MALQCDGRSCGDERVVVKAAAGDVDLEVEELAGKMSGSADGCAGE